MPKSVLWEEQNDSKKIEELAYKVFGSVRNELYLKLRYLDLALGNLPLCPGEVRPAGTDGGVLYFDGEEILRLYQKNRSLAIRLYLHVLFHCLFCHPFGRKDREEKLWDLACDVAAEAVTDSLKLRCAHIASGAFRRSCYVRLEEKLAVLTAEGIYRRLRQMELSERELARWQQEFCLDDHRLWKSGGPKGAENPNRKRWDEIRERMQTELSLFSREADTGEGKLLSQLSVSNRPRTDYREFLKKFTMLREEMQVDPDSFDYIFYHYGMSLYGNMPLIEPQETREVRKIEEFVIVIDTSMSCSGDLVRRFLEETCAVLSQTESFFHDARIHVLQCDEKIQSDRLLKNQREMKEYMEHFTLRGGGGTDFRPAFAYVEQQLAEKKYGKLRGLLYFTDGYGTFPVKMPPYETAFVFVREHYQDVDVPPWAVRLVLEEDDLAEDRETKGERR